MNVTQQYNDNTLSASMNLKKNNAVNFKSCLTKNLLENSITFNKNHEMKTPTVSLKN